MQWRPVTVRGWRRAGAPTENAAVAQVDLAPFLAHARGSRVGGVAVAILCFGIGGLGFVDPTAGLGIQLGLAIPFGLIGLAMLVAVLRPASRHPAIVALRDRAADIVWVYPTTQTVNGVPSQTFIHLGLADGTTRALAIGAKTPPEPLLQQLVGPLGHATFGFSPEREAQFKQAPASLRRG